MQAEHRAAAPHTGNEDGRVRHRGSRSSSSGGEVDRGVGGHGGVRKVGSRRAGSSSSSSGSSSGSKRGVRRGTAGSEGVSVYVEEGGDMAGQNEEHEGDMWEDDAAGYVPVLGQIPEGGDESVRGTAAGVAAPNRRTASLSSAGVEPRQRRRRHTAEDSSLLSRGSARNKHRHGNGGSLQRRAYAESLTKAANMNPSLTSLLSGATHSSSTSSGSGSNTTITEKSYRSKSDNSRRRRYQESSGQHSDTASEMTVTDLESTRSDVFQYLSEDIPEPYSPDAHSIVPQASSTSSGSSDGSQAGHGAASSVGGLEDTNDTPRSSPTLPRKASSDDSHYDLRYKAKSRKPLYQSSFVHGPGDDGAEPENSDEAEESDQGSEEGHDRYSTLKPASPPRRYPSRSSQQSDPHARRLRQQEREHANHVLRAPQPKKGFHFEGASSPTTQPPAAPMPYQYYDPNMYSGASPTEFSATASQASGWPSQPTFPQPLAIGYSPQSAAAYPHQMALRSPTETQSSTGQETSPAFQQASAQLTHYQPPAAGAEGTRPAVSGYELLAHKLSEPVRGDAKSLGSFTPVYRKFEQLNHRVLLHLQDEISELEEELRYLDRCIAQISPRGENGHVQPASRRGDARYGSELHHRRTELLGRVFQKLEQYNSALSSFSNIIRDLDPATPTNIKAYRAWMAKRAPIDTTESQFLERKNDLLALPRRSAGNGNENGRAAAHGAEHDESAAVWFPLLLVLPLMAFTLVPSFFGRLFIVVALGAVEVRMVTTTGALRNFMSAQEWTKAGLVYFGVMAALAGFVH